MSHTLMLGVGGVGLDCLAAERGGVMLLMAPDSDGLGDDAASGLHSRQKRTFKYYFVPFMSSFTTLTKQTLHYCFQAYVNILMIRKKQKI